MPSLLADVNVQGNLPRLEHSLRSSGLWDLLIEEGVRFERFADHGLSPQIDDRPLWHFCQGHQLVLITNNRNHDGPNSLQATLADSWQVGHLPVITFANQGRFVRDGQYASRVADDIANLLFDMLMGGPLDRDRIFVPL